MQEKPKLKLDWATREAAVYACKNWHYSKTLPAGKAVKIGVWENSQFIGVILFGLGANSGAHKFYKVKNTECCELVRIALRKHFYPVSKMLAIALKMLKSFCPEMRLVVSYADMDQGHHGGVYQATNWIYEGIPKDTLGPQPSFIINGKKIHGRTLSANFGRSGEKYLKSIYGEKNVKRVIGKGKHKYLMPLNNEDRMRFSHFHKPYPKRDKQAMDVPTSQRECNAHHHAPLIRMDNA